MRPTEGLGRRLWGTAGFRLALLFGAVFAAASAVLFVVVHLGTVGVVRDEIRQTVAAELAGLLYEQANEGTDGLAELLQARSADPGRHRAMRYGLFDARGRRLAGDLAPPSEDGAFGVVLRDREGEAVPFLAAGATLPDGARLVVAHEARSAHEVEELLQRAFLWAGAATLLLAIGGGIVVARGFLRRVDAIAAVAEAIAAGDLARRVPVAPGSGAQDEMDRLARAINAMLDRINHLMEELRHASSAIAHDLRTPLARLRQTLEAARSGSRSVATYDAAIEEAIADTDGILRTFAALLRIAQVESGSRRAGFADVDLSALAAALADAYGPSIEESGRVLATEIDAGVGIRGDRELLVQAIANLLENAIRHTVPATRIRLSVAGTGDGAPGPVLRVEDDGPGVPAAERGRILGRFHRLDPSRSDGGSGLGLALVAAVAELHDARLGLQAATADGHGLAVSLAFPAAGARGRKGGR